jgi:uncharacterized protein YraI
MKSNDPGKMLRIIISLTILAMIITACGGTGTPAPENIVTPSVEGPTVSAPTAAIATAAATTEPTPVGPVAVLPTPAAGSPSAQALVNTWVLAGPGQEYPVYGAMLGGVTAQIVGISDNSQYWVVSVPVAPQSQGWVDAASIQATNADGVPVVPTPPVPPTVIPNQPSATDPQVTTVQNVYVRSGPGTTYPAYGVVTAGTSGIVLGVSEDSEWWMVRLPPEVVGAGYGWVPADYVTSANTSNVPVVKAPAAQTPVTLPAPSSGVPTATATDYVNLRSGPGTNYTIYGVAAPGATSEVIGVSQDGSWWVVKVPTTIASSGQAWVSASYTVTSNTANVPVVPAPPVPPTVTPPQPPSGSVIGTATEPINVRSGPGSQYHSYGVVPAGTQGQIIGMNSDGTWYQVVIPTSVAPVGYGWVSAAYVQVSGGNIPVVPTPAPPAAVQPLPPTETGATATAIDSINVRSGPGTNYPSYGVVPAGSSAPVVGVNSDGTWWEISVNTENIPEGVAWVSAEYVSVTNTSNVPVVSAPPPPAQLPTAEAPAQGVPYGVATDTINVRSGPGNQYTSYGMVSPGATSLIIGQNSDGTWWVVAIPTSVAPNGQGWVSAAYIDAYNTENVPVVPAPEN